MNIAIIALCVIYLITLTMLAIYGGHRGHLLMLYWKHRKSRPEPKA